MGNSGVYQKYMKSIPTHQPPALLNQAAPVQNTWYTVLDELNCQIEAISINVAVANETLEGRLTVDGVAYNTDAFAATFATNYQGYLRVLAISQAEFLSFDVTQNQVYRTVLTEGRRVKFELRKTTATGAGNLQCIVSWSQH